MGALRTTDPVPGQLAARITFDDEGQHVHIGTLPDRAFALIDEQANGVYVETAFNASGGDTVDVGHGPYVARDGTAVTADYDAFATALDVSSTGWVPFDVGDFIIDADEQGVPVYVTYNAPTADATAGSLEAALTFRQPIYTGRDEG